MKNSFLLLQAQSQLVDVAQNAGSFSSVLAWLAFALLVLVLCLCSFKGFRNLLSRLLRAALVVLCVLVALFGVYVICFDQCGSIPAHSDGKDVLLIGLVDRVRTSKGGDSRRAAFELVDPSGRTTVVTSSGAPPEGGLAVIKGKKGSVNQGKAFVECSFRLSSF